MKPKITYVKIQFDRWIHSTTKAHLFQMRGKEFWLAKWMCKNLIINKKLGGNCSIPTYKYEEIFNCKIEDTDVQVTMIVEHHIPERIEPIEDRTISELER